MTENEQMAWRGLITRLHQLPPLARASVAATAAHVLAAEAKRCDMAMRVDEILGMPRRAACLSASADGLLSAAMFFTVIANTADAEALAAGQTHGVGDDPPVRKAVLDVLSPDEGGEGG